MNQPEKKNGAHHGDVRNAMADALEKPREISNPGALPCCIPGACHASHRLLRR